MKILILSNIFPPGFIGGYELGAYDVAKGLQGSGHRVKVMTSDYFLEKGAPKFDLDVERNLQCTTLGHELVPFDGFLGFYYNFHNIRAIGDVLRRFKPDVVIAFNLVGLGAISIVQFLQRLHVPLLIYLMDNIFTGIELGSKLHSAYETIFGRIEFVNSTRCVAMSRNVVTEVERTVNTILKEIDYVPGWVQTETLGRRELRYHRKDVTRFVFCSRVAPHKGTDVMLSAAQELVRQRHSNFKIDVYGGGQVPQFMQSVQSLGLGQHIAYKGMLEKQEILLALANYDALLFPTWEREPFGFVASEAASAGAFPIMTSGIGASEWFLDGVDCLKISRSPTSLRAAMSLIMSWSDEELINARRRAMNTGWENFEFSKWLNLIEARCEELARKHLRRPDAEVCQVESAFLLLSSFLRESPLICSSRE